MNQARSILIVIGSVIAAAGVAKIAFDSGRAKGVAAATIVPSSSAPSQAAAAASSSVAESPEDQARRAILERMSASQNLAGAVRAATDAFGDTANRGAFGLKALAVWMSAHESKLEDFRVIGATEHAKVMKDPEQERGKGICMLGSIVEIHAQHTDSITTYTGILSGVGKFLWFHVAGSTGDLVERSQARLCGIVAGTVDYNNSGGGMTHAVQVAGLFDLPENHRKP